MGSYLSPGLLMLPPPPPGMPGPMMMPGAVPMPPVWAPPQMLGARPDMSTPPPPPNLPIPGGTWMPKTLLPFETQQETGAIRPAWPGALQSLWQAVTAPSRALSGEIGRVDANGNPDPNGEYRLLNDDGTMNNSALADEAVNMAGAVTLGTGAMPGMPGALNMGLKAYHASPHDFDKFEYTSRTAGTGTGDQDYGRGLYAAEAPAVVDEYARQFGPGAVRYEVDVDADPSHFLDWDKPLSEQSEFVKDALRSAGIDMSMYTNPTGRDLIEFGPDMQGGVEPLLHDAGIQGVRFLDANLRKAGEGTRNYVVFNDKIISIIRKYRQGVDDGTTLARNSSGLYNPPDLMPRPFAADYPGGTVDAHQQALPLGAPLQFDIEGRPLFGGDIVGRQMVGGADVALPPARYGAVTEEAIGAGPQGVPPETLPRGAVGAYVSPNRDNPYRQIQFSSALAADDAVKVVGHEMGHMIDDLSRKVFTDAGIPQVGIKTELRAVFAQNNPQRYPNPEAMGYNRADVDRELMAEAIRAYMANPNWIKTVAPTTAAVIRKYVNSNPRINKIVQFNMGGSLAGLPLLQPQGFPTYGTDPGLPVPGSTPPPPRWNEA